MRAQGIDANRESGSSGVTTRSCGRLLRGLLVIVALVAMLPAALAARADAGAAPGRLVGSVGVWGGSSPGGFHPAKQAVIRLRPITGGAPIIVRASAQGRFDATLPARRYRVAMLKGPLFNGKLVAPRPDVVWIRAGTTTRVQFAWYVP
jgi:hypothetical protein